MNLPHLEMRQTSAKIGMQTTPLEMRQTQRPADLSIEQPQGELTIETVAARLEIDSSQAWIEMGRIPAFESVRRYADLGQQMVREGTGRVASEGDQLMRIEQKGEVIARIAKMNDTPPAEVTTMGFIPRSLDRVKINFTPAEVNVRYTARKPVIDVTTHRPELEVTEGKTDIFLRERNQLDMWPVGGIYDEKG
ncbi:hypothetical protein ASF99_08420 [Exiguobacterium sp. Leaf187]|uniref:Uncharacterized protein n=1 Tax=Exiguobacterium indicum TaxID=296995 RepID=A0A0V8GIM0_9BACL|nr:MULTISPECIES: DUF6470 family protein [Exiguobacterium]AHA30662.1 hypothetical protein U719_13545 [Exiguobacterium sp. MH3]KQS19899.1 hypothetical protein ASF99_08420 [Exiguobacterium sp. Leaf187]KSU50098.1 hypothetical protein AS033_01620 [Exiguobacterium enclense]SDB89202.1 hypothetical protein SAMN05216342_0332 [Exiguobacterium enclense]